jgi:TRAP-type C4-dicarboxylate transport system permease large subunit
MIIPPSLVLILYGVLTENSIIALFLAAIVPGCLAVVFYFLSVGVTGPPRASTRPNRPEKIAGDTADTL